MKPITLPIAMLVATLVVVGAGCSKKKTSPAAAGDAGSALVEGAKVAEERGATARDKATFLVQISLTSGEQGKDSNATQTHVSIIDDRLFFTETPRGAFANKRPRLNVAVTLDQDERRTLEQALKDLGLFEIETIKTTKQPDGPHSYASMTVKLRLDAKEHSFALSGVTGLPGAGATAFAATSGYKGVTRFIEDVARLARTKHADSDAPPQ